MSKSNKKLKVAFGGKVEVQQAAAEADGPPSFSAVAYSGELIPVGAAQLPRLDLPYIIDLGGIQPANNVKANLDHKEDQRVGHITDIINDGQQLSVSGILSAATPHQEQVVRSAKQGYTWEVSVEGLLWNQRKLAASKSAEVNGRKVTGPLYIFGAMELTDIAFVSHGADTGNFVRIAASAAGDKAMTDFEKYVVACGSDPEAITEEQRANLQEAFDLKMAKAANPAPAKPAAPVKDLAAAVRMEESRKDGIRKLALSAMKDHPTMIDAIEAMATDAEEKSMSEEQFELSLLRSTRGSGRDIRATHSNGRLPSDPLIIECALARSVGLPNVEKHYNEKTLEAVDRAGLRELGIQRLLLSVASANGYHVGPGERITTGNIRQVLEYCFPPVYARMSGFSTISLPGILGNVANKEILEGYMEEDNTWQEIASVKTATNFHQITAYRMLDDLEYEEVGPTGEIKHGKVDQESFTRQLKTYAKMLGLPRQSIINDDAGAFDDIRERIGRGAALKFNNIFWASFMDNASFFTTARTNYIEGSTSNLGTDGVGLGLTVTAYRKLRSPTADGSKRVGVSAGAPSILLVPPEVEFIADALYNGGSPEQMTVASTNVHRRKYRPIVQNRLSDSAFTGNSTTAFYLFGPSLKPMVVSFLNGRRTPVVESADADFNTLGIQFRGVHDFGADQAEYLSGVKSKGAA